MVPFVLKPQVGQNSAIERGYHITQAYYMRFAGLYPDLQSGYRYWLFGLYINFIQAAYAYYIYAYVISTWYALKYRDVQLVGETLCYGSYTYVYFLVLCVFFAQRGKIDKILDVSGQGVFNYERPWTPEEVQIQKTEARKAETYGRYGFAFSFVLGFTQMGIIPAIRGFRGQYTSVTKNSAPINKYSPLPVWTPYEATDGLSFFVAYCCQLLPGMIEFFIMHASCTFFVGCCCVLVSNLKLLHHSLNTITVRAEGLYIVRGGKIKERRELFDNKAFQECMVDSLKENIKHHVKIVEFFKLCQSVIGRTTFFIFVGAIVNLSAPPYTIVKCNLMGLFMIVEERKFQVLEAATWLGAFRVAALGELDKVYTSGMVMLGHMGLMLLLLSRYCLYGQDVMTLSTQTLHAYFSTPWPDCDIKYCRLLLIAMSNSLTTITPRAFFIGTAMSAATLLDTLKKGYSLFNLLITTS